MKITRIKVDAFGKLTDLDLKLDSHFNIIYGRNESGKTTLYSFIKSIILGKEKHYNKYLPWEDEKRFGGSLYLEDDDGNEQKITRDFLDKDLDEDLIEFSSVLSDDTSDDSDKQIKEAQELKEKIEKQLEEFYHRKEELEKKSKEFRKRLVKHEFYKEEDVKDCKENVDELLKKYQEELEKDKKEVPLVNPYLLGIAGILFLINFLLFKSTILSVGCVFFAIAYILFQIIHKPMNFNEDLELEEQIEEIYEEFLENNELTEENYKKFCEEMKTYSSLFKKILDGQLNLEKIEKEIEKLEGYQKRMESEIEQLLKEQLQGISLSEKVSDIVFRMTDGKYQKVMVNSKFEITIQVGSKFISIESLSKGCIEQIYLAIRIAVIELLWPDEEMPLLLDDSFAFYDDERLEQTIYYLYEYYNGQVILFTCQKRENEIANKLEFFYRNLTLDA